MKYDKIINFIMLFCLPCLGYGQNTLHGLVKDSEGAMIGATIVVTNIEKRVLFGVVTDLNGEYAITLPAIKDLMIEFSFVGYKTKRVAYKGQKVLNMTLEEDIHSLKEVVVEAKAVERNSMGIKVKDLGVARQSINLAEFEDMPVTSVEDMLQGKLANVDIVASSGDPGAKSSIRIRGTSSLNASNEPLIVIDDIPFTTEIGEDFDFATATDEDFGALVNIAPSDIESIEVLKDAAATAIWGAKAGNGVLLITTKKGRSGKPFFSINQKINYKREPKGIPMLNAEQYVTLLQDGIWNNLRDQGFPHGGAMNLLTKYKDIRFDPTYTWFDEFNQETDWIDLITKSAMVSETNFSMSGGGDRATYRFSAGYLSEGGTTVGTSFDRISTRLNVDYRFSNKLKFSSSFSYAEGDRKSPFKSDIRAYARNKMPNMSAFVLDDDGNFTSEYFTNPTTDPCIQGTWESSSQYNPLAMAKESKNNTITRNMRVTFALDYNFLKGIKFQQNVAIDLGSTKNKKYLPQSATGVIWTHKDCNRGSDNMSDNITVTTNSKLLYNCLFNEDHSVVFSAMLETRSSNSSNYSSSVSGMGAAEVADPTAGGKITELNSGTTQNRSVGMVVNGHYNFKDKYLLSAFYRYDGNSKMGANSRWGGFPSLSGAYRISNENFLKDVAEVEEIKFRGSWGKSGNSPTSNYVYVGKFTQDGTYMGEESIKPSSVQLNNLKWEIRTDYNIGLDLHFFDRKFSVVLEYYRKKSEDLLQRNVPVNTTSGFSNIGYFNSGSIENRGWEIMIDLRDIIKIRDFSVSITNLNLSRNRNRVLELPSNMNYEKYSFGNGNYAQNVIEENPLGSFYGYKCKGVYQNISNTYAYDQHGERIIDIYGNTVITTINNVTMRPGDAWYDDINRDGIIDKYDIVYLGNSMPIVIGGGSINITYKGFKLRGSLQTRIGQSVINRARMNSENMYNANNQSRAVLNRWRYEGDDTNIPRALYGRGYNYLGSDRFVEKATFLRLKDVMLSYTFPKHLISHLGLKRVACNLTGYDVFTWTNYKGQDPEVGLGGGIYQTAQDNSYTPRPFRMSFGLTVDF